jgi:hypothetical protein
MERQLLTSKSFTLSFTKTLPPVEVDACPTWSLVRTGITDYYIRTDLGSAISSETTENNKRSAPVQEVGHTIVDEISPALTFAGADTFGIPCLEGPPTHDVVLPTTDESCAVRLFSCSLGVRDAVAADVLPLPPG